MTGIDTLPAWEASRPCSQSTSFLEAYHDDLILEALGELPTAFRPLDPSVDLVNEVHWVARWVTIATANRSESFELRRLDLYELAGRYPELKLGW